MPKTNKNSLLRNIIINKLFLIALTLFLLYIVSAFAATNVSVLYGWNGSATVPVQVDSAGRLKTTLNLSKSTGISPESDNAYDLGTTALRWRTGYIIDLVSAGNIYAVGLNASSINITGNAYFATSSGKVGIGATSPNTTFHVSGTANITGTLSVGSFEISNAGVGSMNVTGRTLLGLNGIESSVGVSTLSPLSRFHVNDSSAIGAFRVTNVSGTTLFFINGSSGKIGVRTTNIDTEFKVAGNVNITDTLWVNNENVTAPTNVSLQYVFDGSQFVGARGTSAGIMQLDVVSQSADKALDSFTVTNDLVVDTNTLVVNATNNRVGIGTASPYNELVVIGSIGVSGSLNATSINTTGSAYFATSSGNVGIGTTSPNFKLDVAGQINASAVNVTGTVQAITFIGDGSSLTGITSSTSVWNSSGTNVYLNDSTASVGIGTTTPTNLLTVAGNANVTDKLYVNVSYVLNAQPSYNSMDDELVLYLPFSRGNKSSDPTVFDRSKFGNHGTCLSTDSDYGCNWTSGPNGNALLFDGNVVEVFDDDSLSFGDGSNDNPFSIAVWMNGKTFTGADHAVVHKGSEYQVWMESNTLRVRLSDDSASVNSYSQVAVPDTDVWKFVVVTYDGRGSTDAATGLSFYYDTILQSPTSTVSDGNYIAMENLANNVYIGATTSGASRPFNGTLDEVRIYDKLLSDEEIKELYLSGLNSTLKPFVDISGNVGIGTSSPTHQLHVVGDANITNNLYLGQNLTDLAENIFSAEDVGAGDVVVISDDMKVIKSYKAYDKKVVGVISTAPAATFGGSMGNVPLAISGRVPVKATDENGFIEPGDLLTTSSTLGYAMKCNDYEKCFGNTIGKAITPLEQGIVTMMIMLN